MATSSKKSYLLMITKGREDGGQAAMLAMKLAVSFQAIGHEVTIFLTLAGTRWAYKETGNGILEANDASLEDYFEQYQSMGGELMVCSPCLAAYCSIPQVGEEELARSMRENARYVGLASVAERLFVANASVF